MFCFFSHNEVTENCYQTNPNDSPFFLSFIASYNESVEQRQTSTLGKTTALEIPYLNLIRFLFVANTVDQLQLIADQLPFSTLFMLHCIVFLRNSNGRHGHKLTLTQTLNIFLLCVLRAHCILSKSFWEDLTADLEGKCGICFQALSQYTAANVHLVEQ